MLQPAIKCVFILQADSEAVIFVTLLLSRHLSVVFLFISNLTNGLRLHQFLMSKTTKANKSLKTDANRAH